jgi:hypothetical protein
MLRNLDIEEFRAERRARELIRLDPETSATTTTTTPTTPTTPTTSGRG